MNKQGTFSSHIESSNKFNITCNFIQILQIRQSIPLEWRNIINKESIKENNIYILLHGYFCIDLSMCPVNMSIFELITPSHIIKNKNCN